MCACALRVAAEASATPKPAAAERHLGIAVFVDLAAVVARAFVLVGQQVIGLRHLGETLRRLGIVLVAIGVKLLGEAAVRLLDLGFASAPLQSQALVKVECHNLPMPEQFRPDQMGCRRAKAKPKARTRCPIRSPYLKAGSPKREMRSPTTLRRWRWLPPMRRAGQASAWCC